jgi:hypothetical protein
MIPPYLVDSNFFIEAHRRSYPLDVFHSFWDKVAALAVQKKICSIDRVKAEIFENEDELKVWCKAKLPEDFWLNSSSTVLTKYPEVINWAVLKLGSPYSQNALDEFLHAEEADAWLVAFAMDHGITVVTNEVAAPDSKKKIKIPDACIGCRVRYILPIDMFRALSVHI